MLKADTPITAAERQSRFSDSAACCPRLEHLTYVSSLEILELWVSAGSSKEASPILCWFGPCGAASPSWQMTNVGLELKVFALGFGPGGLVP